MINYLLCTAVTIWDEPIRSRHQVANELKKKGIVYFVERNRVGKPRIEVRKVEDNVILISPYFFIDYRIRYRTPLLNEIYYNWLLTKIRGLNIDFEIVFTYDHTSHLINNFYNNVVYYCSDDHIGNGNFNPFFVNAYHRKTEHLLAAKVKMCIVTVAYLYNKLIQVNKNTHIVPLGTTTVEEALVKFKPNNNPVPTLALVAYIDKRMPLKLLDDIVNNFSLVFIGPSKNEIRKRYLNNTNAKFVGVKNGKELFEIINGVDICIAPYNEKKINKGLTPSKLWLYLSFGKPVVITNLKNIQNLDFGDKIIYKCNDDDFVERIWEAYNDNNIELFKKRIKLSKTNSWEKRIDQILRLYYSDYV